MLLFDPLHPKISAVIELLAEKTSLTTKELKKELKKEKGVDVSPANFYKIVAKMLENKILIKVGKQVSINKMWATHVHKYSSMMGQNVEGKGNVFKPFKQGEKRTLQAESLEALDSIWLHSTLYLFTQESDEVIYMYNVHPVYFLANPEVEWQMYNTCLNYNKTVHILYGNNSFLDRHAHELYKRSPIKTAIAKKTPFPKEGYGLWMCGEYILEITYPEFISNYWANIFKNTKTLEEFKPKQLKDIFEVKIPCEMTITRDKKRAQELLKTFKSSFKK